MLELLLPSLIPDGAMVVRGPDERAHAVGGVTEANAPLIVRIHDNATLRRIGADPGLAVGEAYMEGKLTIERGTLYDFLAVATRNLSHIAALKRRWRPWRMLRRNPKRRARRNVAHHYDLSRELFGLFLDEDLQYSCAYFPHPGMSLEEAQAAKKRHLAAKLLLRPGLRVLDIGSGWGGLGLSLASDYGADVQGVTLSREQLGVARMRAARMGLDRRAKFDLRDYRDLDGAFDRIVSVGMFEHVGPADYRAFFESIAARLAPDGVAVLHTIGRTGSPGPGNAWIEKYIFPGGVIPSLSQVVSAVEEAGLILTDVEVLRLHYAETLRHWRERFAARRDEVRELYDERFCRMWEFYLAGSEAGFREGDLVVFQLQLAKDQAAIPLTRDYITEADRAEAAVHGVAAE